MIVRLASQRPLRLRPMGSGPGAWALSVGPSYLPTHPDMSRCENMSFLSSPLNEKISPTDYNFRFQEKDFRIQSLLIFRRDVNLGN